MTDPIEEFQKNRLEEKTDQIQRRQAEANRQLAFEQKLAPELFDLIDSLGSGKRKTRTGDWPNIQQAADNLKRYFQERAKITSERQPFNFPPIELKGKSFAEQQILKKQLLAERVILSSLALSILKKAKAIFKERGQSSEEEERLVKFYDELRERIRQLTEALNQIENFLETERREEPY